MIDRKMDKAALSSELEDTFHRLLQLMSNIYDDQFNVVPFPGSWTAGQLVKHLEKSGKGFLEIINGPVAEAERAPDLFTDQIKADFLDFSSKTKSPDFVLPAEINYNKEHLMGSMEKIKERFLEAVDGLDLTKLGMSFELPYFGYLTRLEAVYFVIYHTQRHNHQLKNILQHLSKMALGKA